MTEEISDIQKRKIAEQKKYWTNHVAAWEKSGLSLEEYSEKAEVPYGQLKWWAWNLMEKYQFLSKSVKPEEKEEKREIEIRLPGSLSIIVKKGFEEDLLKKVIKSLGGCHV